MRGLFNFLMIGDPIQMSEKRKEDRFRYEIPDSAFIEIKIGRESQNYKLYDLKVSDCSKYGLGILVTEEDFDLLHSLEHGDPLLNIAFFSTWTVQRLDGTVCHKTKVGQGEYEGCYIMGIQSQNTIEYCQPNNNK